MAQPEIGEVLSDITADVQTIVKGEIELAKAEMVPQLKRAAIGGGMFGAAGYLALQAATLLFICGGLAFTGLYISRLSTVWAFTLGFLTMAVILLLIAGVLVLLGLRRVKVSAPEKTIDEANRSIEAVSGAVAQGQANVRAIAAGAPRSAVEDQVLPGPSAPTAPRVPTTPLPAGGSTEARTAQGQSANL